MNGKYVISNPMTGKPMERTFTEYNSYPRPTEYFDVYSPKISTLYSQVFWTQMDKVELPENIVKRFANKTMAVVGFEIDQVFKGENGGEDISVPINVAYNHHFESEMLGKGASLEKIVLNDPSDARARDMGARQKMLFIKLKVVIAMRFLAVKLLRPITKDLVLLMVVSTGNRSMDIHQVTPS